MASLAGLWRRYELKGIGLMAQPPSPEGYGGQGAQRGGSAVAEALADWQDGGRVDSDQLSAVSVQEKR